MSNTFNRDFGKVIMKQFLIKNEVKIARLSIIVIFLALVRCIAEPFRLQAIASEPIYFDEVKAFLIAALLCAIGLISMNLLLFYSKYRSIPFIAFLIILVMLLIKMLYL